jgi:hypothetical protein
MSAENIHDRAAPLALFLRPANCPLGVNKYPARALPYEAPHRSLTVQPNRKHLVWSLRPIRRRQIHVEKPRRIPSH